MSTPPQGGTAASGQVATPPIRGRSAELTVIASQLASLGQGRGGVLVIEGPAGIGKSRLVAELMTLAGKPGVRTLFGQAFEYQQTVPFFSLFTATLHADPPVGDATALRNLGSSGDLQYWVVQDLGTAIRAAAAEAPLVIILEDIHWADNATVLALRTLTATLTDSPVLWVLTARTGAGTPAIRDLISTVEQRGAVSLPLSAMPHSGVIDMVEDAVRARADVSLLNLVEKAHGNPFLVTEFLGGLGEEHRLEINKGCAVAIGENLPKRLSASMKQRLDALSHAARDVVQVAAVLPDRFTAALLARMLERPPAALMSAVDEAVRVHLLIEDGDELRFRHDLLRDATRESLPRSLRRAIERQSAGVMLEMGAAPAEVATQLARSADIGDRGAVTALREAAQSVANSDQSAAADLSRRALDLLPADDSQRGSVLTETVVLLNRSGRYQEAEELAIAMLSQLSPEEEAQARLRIPAAADSLEVRVAENRRALRLSSVSDVTRARHQAWLACNHAVSGLPVDESILVDAVAAAEATGDPESRIVCEISSAIIDYVDGHALRALRLLDEIDIPTPVTDLAFVDILTDIHRANLLNFMGRSDEAAAVAARGVETAHREGSDMALALWAPQSAMIQLAAGRLSAARHTLEEVAPELLGALSEMSMNRWLILAEVAVHAGDRELLQSVTAEARAANPTGGSLVNCGAAYVLAMSAWHSGDRHEAVRWLSGISGKVLTPLHPNGFDQLILTARVAAAAGDAGLRARVLRSVELLEHDSNELPLFAAVIRHARGILERSAAALIEAAAELRSVRPLLSACACEDAGEQLAHSGSNAEAIDQFNAAFDTYVRCEAVTDARRVGRSLRRLGVERRINAMPRDKSGWNSLTDAELKVINLIADGATNGAVARRLHLSPHTVKSHVRNAFAKLGINSRTQLPSLISENALEIPRSEP